MASKKRSKGVFISEQVVFLHCTPGDINDGPVTIVAVAGKQTGTITHINLSLQDTRTLVTQLLVSLYSSSDKTAEKLLDSNFATDPLGNFCWPPDEEDWLGSAK